MGKSLNTSSGTVLSEVISVSLGEKEVLVWQKETWGSYGQHANIYTFVIDVKTKTQEPIFRLVNVRHENHDSRKNIHRKTFVAKSELTKLNGKILKVVHDYKSSSKQKIDVEYFKVENSEMVKLNAERGLRDEKGFYDLLKFGENSIKVRKDIIEVV